MRKESEMNERSLYFLLALVVVSSSTTTTWIIPSGYAQQTTSNVNSDSIDPNSYLLVSNLTSTTSSLGNFSTVLITQDATNSTNTVIILVSEVQNATNQIPYEEDTLYNVSQVWGYDLTSLNFTTVDNHTSLIAVLEESPTNMSSASASSQNNNNTNTSSTEEGNGTKAGPQPAIVASPTIRDTDWPFALKPHQEDTAPSPAPVEEEQQSASTPTTTESNGQTESEPGESASTDETGTNEESEGETEESEEAEEEEGQDNSSNNN